MTQKDKKLLLKDLSARLPYGVIVSPIDCGKAKLIGFKDGYPILFDLMSQKEYDKPWEIEYIKPYLRPMSSMTKEERCELCNIRPCYINSDDIVNGTQCNTFIQASECQDWLNAHHFDYRGLIEKGLALEAPEGMY